MGKQFYSTDETKRFGIFTQVCDNCGTVNEVKTQIDNDPEYYTDVYTYCECGHELLWELPVN